MESGVPSVPSTAPDKPKKEKKPGLMSRLFGKKKKPTLMEQRNQRLDKSAFWKHCLEKNTKKYNKLVDNDSFRELFKKVDRQKPAVVQTVSEKPKKQKKKEFVSDPNLKKTLNIICRMLSIPLEVTISNVFDDHSIREV